MLEWVRKQGISVKEAVAPQGIIPHPVYKWLGSY
jgi:hypothetical protein